MFQRTLRCCILTIWKRGAKRGATGDHIWLWMAAANFTRALSPFFRYETLFCSPWFSNLKRGTRSGLLLKYESTLLKNKQVSKNEIHYWTFKVGVRESLHPVQKIKVKTFLEKFSVQIEFQCSLLLKIAIFNSRIWNFPKSGFTYRFRIKLDFFLKKIRH